MEELKTTKNEINVEGALLSYELETGKTEKGEDMIRGHIRVKVGEDKDIRISVYTTKYKKDGEIKKNYEKLLAMKNKEYRTIADCREITREDGTTYKEQPAYVSVFGQGDFTPKIEEYITKNGTGLQYSLGFGNLVVDNDREIENPHATFEVDMYVTSNNPELDKDQEETGRAVIKGYIVNFGGAVVPLTIIVPKEATEVDPDTGDTEIIPWAETLLDAVEEGTTCYFGGDIVNATIITENKIKKLGRTKVETKKEYINELICNFCDNELEEGKQYEQDDIRKAVTAREAKIEAKKNEEDKPKAKKGGLRARGKNLGF